MTAAMGPKVKGDAVAEVPVPVDPTDAERRGTPRVLVHLEVDCASEDNYLFAYIEIEGDVIWINPYRPGTPDNLHPGMGIRFVKLDSAVRDRLFELIRRFAYLS
jgi:hypothetical protein